MQNPLASTSFIVADQIDFRLRAYQLQAGREFTFVRPNYILNCITAEALLPLSPLYLTVLPLKNLSFYRENFDRFHDSYTASLGICELEEILANMNDSYPINETLVAKIALRQPRQGQVTYCIGVSELIRAKLVLAGDVIVDSLELFPNTIIVGRELTGQEQNELENYQRREPTLVTSLKELIDAGVL